MYVFREKVWRNKPTLHVTKIPAFCDNDDLMALRVWRQFTHKGPYSIRAVINHSPWPSKTTEV